MLDTQVFGHLLNEAKFNFFSGVPCSFLKPLINYAINECEYVAAANEGDAVAIATGATLGGRRGVALMQNSGLTNATSPLTSLNYTFKIPILGFVSLRGEPGLKDEPQHELMGQITEKMLSLMEVDWVYLSSDIKEIPNQLKIVEASLERERSFFFVVKKDTFSSQPLNEINNPLPIEPKEITIPETNPILQKRRDVLQSIVDIKNDQTVVLATTGHTGRELYEVSDRTNHLYMVGSMGCISSLGLGLSLVQPHKKVIVIDGDGSLLMRMGSLATAANYQPKNLLHLILDNGIHASTGGQKTVSNIMDVKAIAKACGTQRVAHVVGKKGVQQIVDQWMEVGGHWCVHIPISPESPKSLSRPSIRPHEVAKRFREHLSG
jgi:phosphonopyruvate decarboxylase